LARCDLQLVDHSFLAKEGDARVSRVATIAAHRGTITIAMVSRSPSAPPLTPSGSTEGTGSRHDQIPRLAAALSWIARSSSPNHRNLDRQFLYLARGRQPSEAEQIKALGIPGVYLSREYRRYYPSVSRWAHPGFTNVDDAGQEGLELAFDHWLGGEDGRSV